MRPVASTVASISRDRFNVQPLWEKNRNQTNVKTIIFYLQYIFVRVVASLLVFIPFGWTLKAGRAAGILLYYILRRPRQMAFQNLRQAFKNEKSEPEIKRIANESFVHLAEFGAEWLRMPEMIRRPERYLIDVYNKQAIHHELATKKRGAIVLICHTGNWEVMALMGGLFVAKPVNIPLYAVARPLDNPYLYEFAMKLRGGMGLKTIDKSGGVRDTFDKLRKENAIVCILIDQRISEGSVEVPFFNRPALTTSLPVVAALRLGTPIFHNFLYRTDKFRYEMKVEGPLAIERTGNFKRDIEINTEKFLKRIEREIRKDPARWLWMHNRWRVPDGAKE